MAIAHPDTGRSVLELDPDLGLGLAPARQRVARAELRAEVLELRPGPWEPEWRPVPGHLGFLVADGVLSREVVAGESTSPELLGPGDVARPWDVDSGLPLLPVEVRWNVLAEAQLVVLDLRFAARLARHPEVGIALAERVEARAQRLATLRAIGRLGPVDERLLALFWHLADRWGRVTRDGVVVPLTLSHRMLGQMIGARRPTVTAALGRLSISGRLLRREDAAWLLVGTPQRPDDPAAAVQPRRRLIAGHALEMAPPPAVFASAADARADSSGSRTALREMAERLARIRTETEERAQALHDVVALSTEICRTTGDLRDARIRV
jgi:CRP/FNR family transcriptional regulator, cyclic AMP receptor protein